MQKEVQEEVDAVGAFDMFSASPAGNQEMMMMKPLHLAAGMANGDMEHLQSNWDDQDGASKAIVGEVIDNRCRVMGTVGKGVLRPVIKFVHEDRKEVGWGEN